MGTPEELHGPSTLNFLEIFQTRQTEEINRIFKKKIHSRKTLVKKQYEQKEYCKDIM